MRTPLLRGNVACALVAAWAFLSSPLSADGAPPLRVTKADSGDGWAVPRALAACPLDKPEAVLLQGVCLTKTQIQRCVRDWIQEDSYSLRGDTVEVTHSWWSIASGSLLTQGKDVVAYEVWIAPVANRLGEIGAVLGATWRVWYIAPERGGLPRVRQEADEVSLPSWVFAAAPGLERPPNCAVQPSGAGAPAAER